MCISSSLGCSVKCQFKFGSCGILASQFCIHIFLLLEQEANLANFTNNLLQLWVLWMSNKNAWASYFQPKDPNCPRRNPLLSLLCFPCASMETLLQFASFTHSCMNSLSSSLVGLPRWLSVKNLPANSGDPRVMGSIPGRERSPGRGNDNPLQYSCLEKPMDRGASRAIVHGITEESDAS